MHRNTLRVHSTRGVFFDVIQDPLVRLSIRIAHMSEPLLLHSLFLYGKYSLCCLQSRYGRRYVFRMPGKRHGLHQVWQVRYMCSRFGNEVSHKTASTRVGAFLCVGISLIVDLTHELFQDIFQRHKTYGCIFLDDDRNLLSILAQDVQKLIAAE